MAATSTIVANVRRLVLHGAIGFAVTVVSAGLMLVTVLIWEEPANIANVAGGPLLWVGSAFTFGCYMVSLGVEAWAIRALARPLQH